MILLRLCFRYVATKNLAAVAMAFARAASGNAAPRRLLLVSDTVMLAFGKRIALLAFDRMDHFQSPFTAPLTHAATLRSRHRNLCTLNARMYS